MLRSRPSRAAGSAVLFLFACLGFALWGLGPAGAQSGSELRRETESSYHVLPVRGGIVLKPKAEESGIESIEISGSAVKINGVEAPLAVVRAWLAEDAALVERLLEAGPSGRRQLFGFSSEGGELAPAPAEPPSVPSPPSERSSEELTEEPEALEVPEPPEPPEPPDAADPEQPVYRSGEQVSVFNDVVVAPGESVRDAVAFLGNVTVLGEVRDDVTAINGNVEIQGRVEGDVVAVHGSVKLGPKARVLGGVRSVGGQIDRDPSAVVEGRMEELPLVGVPRWSWDDEARSRGWRHGWGGWWSTTFNLMGNLIVLGMILLVAALCAVFAPRWTERSATQIEAEWWRAGLVGVLTWFLFGPLLALVVIALVITVIGCLLLIPLAIVLPFVIVIYLAVGFTAASLALGRTLLARFNRPGAGVLTQVVLGALVIQACSFVGDALMSVGGPAGPLGFAIDLVGGFVRFCAITIGIGAVLLTRHSRWLGPLAGGPPKTPAVAPRFEAPIDPPGTPTADELAPIAWPPIDDEPPRGEETKPGESAGSEEPRSEEKS